MRHNTYDVTYMYHSVLIDSYLSCRLDESDQSPYLRVDLTAFSFYFCTSQTVLSEEIDQM